MPACHAGGRGFEPLPHRQMPQNSLWGILVLYHIGDNGHFRSRQHRYNGQFCHEMRSRALAGNALLLSVVYGIRYPRGPSTVRNMRAVLKTASWCTRRVFGGAMYRKRPSLVRTGHVVPQRAFWSTECIFKDIRDKTGFTLFP